MVGSTSTLDAATPADRPDRSDSWYLDPVVARQKADAFLALVERWRDPSASGPTLKTDLFEEANGEDALVPRLEPRSAIIACDLDLRTARRAQRRFAASGLGVFVGDLRRIGLRDGVLDLAVSPSTLDHFTHGEDIEVALREIRRVLRPGGVYALNVIDQPPLKLVRAEIATLRAVFGDVALVAPRDGGGNFVLLAAEGPLPALAAPRDGRRLDAVRFAADAEALRDMDAPADQLLSRR
jgi:SAM-dependent methyltransferase